MASYMTRIKGTYFLWLDRHSEEQQKCFCKPCLAASVQSQMLRMMRTKNITRWTEILPEKVQNWNYEYLYTNAGYLPSSNWASNDWVLVSNWEFCGLSTGNELTTCRMKFESHTHTQFHSHKFLYTATEYNMIQKDVKYRVLDCEETQSACATTQSHYQRQPFFCLQSNKWRNWIHS